LSIFSVTMEISLLSKDGITDNSILSIRAGAIKRQALIDSGRPFRFPKLGMEENPVRITILQQIGSAYLVTKPSERRYQIVFDTGGSCEVEVKASAENAEEPKAGEAESKENSNTAKEAKDYLEQHQLLQFVQGVLQAVIKEKPKNPFTYIARHFMSGYESEKQKESKAAEPMKETQSPAAVEVAPPPEDTIPPPAPAGAAKCGAAEVVSAEEASQKASAPSQAQACVVPAKEEAPGPQGDEAFDVEVLRAQVQDSLMRATVNGTLSKTFEVVRPIGKEAEQVQHPQAEQAEQPEVQPGDLRLRMKGTLLSATEDGSLLKAMQAVLAEQTAENTAGNQPIPTDELIKQVQETFSKAERDGTLANALERAISHDVQGVSEIEDVRARARDALHVACKGIDVAEEEVTQKVTNGATAQPVPLDELRTKVAAALIEAKDSGTLGTTLEAVGGLNRVDTEDNPSDPKMDDLRVRMKDTLLQATNDGSLQDAIEKALHDTKEDELRARAVGVLADAVGAGTLESALKEARANRSGELAS